MVSTNASDSIFGWDFQINAAIVLMLEDIENVQKVRVEGQTEDIEITLTNGEFVFSQAKALSDPSKTKNVRKKLSDGLGTLNQAAKQTGVCKLVYITNAYDPLADKQSMPSFYGQSRKPYVSLMDSAKKVIDNILAKENYSEIDKSKLFIYTLPFENDLNDRYKVVIEKVKDFIASIRSNLSGSAQEVLDIWQQQLFENATLHDTAIVLTKKEIMWPLIVIMCDDGFRANPFSEDIDDGMYDEVSSRYRSFISCKCQKFSFVTRVLSDYQAFVSSKAGNERIIEFVNNRWNAYLDEFSSDESEEVLNILVKIILFQLLRQRYLINEVKKEGEAGMMIKSLTITEGRKSKTYEFSSQVNLIHSDENTVGKTTLLRLMLYSLGYQIPNTKNMKFGNCVTQVLLDANEKTYRIKRENEYLLVDDGTSTEYYILPTELNQFHSIIFETDNYDVLNNLLGTFYMDQEKGWTLLNRGKVIGNISFNVEKLVLGLSERDYQKLQSELQLLEREIKKYQQMRDIAQYQREIYEEKGDIIHDTYDESLKRDLSVYMFDAEALRKELKQLTETIADNTSVRKFIEKMSLWVKAPDGTKIPVNQDTIIGLEDNTDFLLSRKRLLTSQIAKLELQIEKLRNLIYYQSQQPTTETLIEAFDKNLSQISIDTKAVESILNELIDRQSEVKRQLSELAKHNNDILEEMYSDISSYGIELGLTQYMSSSSNFVFTRNLKELTGATLMKMVFAFKMAYIRTVDRVLNIKLPLILDSPSGKELDQYNIQKLINIINRDFTEHQVIVASIYHYKLDSLTTIEMGRRVVC